MRGQWILLRGFNHKIAYQKYAQGLNFEVVQICCLLLCIDLCRGGKKEASRNHSSYVACAILILKATNRSLPCFCIRSVAILW